MTEEHPQPSPFTVYSPDEPSEEVAKLNAIKPKQWDYPVHWTVKISNAFVRVLEFCEPVLVPVLGVFFILTGWRPGTDKPWSGVPDALLNIAVWLTFAVLIWNLL